MAEFQFSVLDSSGQARSGRLQAGDLQQARQRLQSKGYIVVSLKPLGVAVLREGGRSYQEPPLDRLGRRLQSLQKPILCLLTLLGLAMTAFYWDRSGMPKKSRSYQPCQLVITGNLPSQEVSAVTVRLPELPARFQFTPQQALSKSGQLHLEISFESSRTPSQCEVVIDWSSGRPTRVQEVHLSGSPLTADLGMLVRP